MLPSVKKAEQKVVNDPNANKVYGIAWVYATFQLKFGTTKCLFAHSQQCNGCSGYLQEYLGIAGNPDFCKLSAKLAFGANSRALKEGRAATVQSLSGTGSLRVCCCVHALARCVGLACLSIAVWCASLLQSCLPHIGSIPFHIAPYHSTSAIKEARPPRF